MISFLIPQLWGLAIISSTESFNRLIGLGKHRLREDQRMIFKHMSFASGLSEFSLRMLSEGRFQSIVWTRNTAESVLVTQLLKGIREMKADIDLVALECLKEQSLAVPDRHKKASAFMQPLVDVLLKEIKSRVQVPATSSSADSEELIRAKAKLAQAGLTLTPRNSPDSGSPTKPEI